MQVHLRYFAGLRELVGHEQETLDFPEETDVAAARAALAERYPVTAALLTRCIAAVNRSYVTPDRALAPGDELAFIPPLGGGSPWSL
ncbi:MAG TPA: molybdopterin converting factor subunit 1 [Ktedonobacterales bacterium]|jgi:molybdopterin converting factor subunit 1|nr:molybdopterin converting factor subunit 1 [Ktedonobacterales bacterium]